jgi:AcrR family transcriptional regulator
MQKEQMNGFKRRKEQKKESIRRAALELFQTFGFKKVSVSEIARRAGVSQVTIYNHFGSKEALVRDVLKWYILQLFEKYESVMNSKLTFQEKLENIVFDKTQVVSRFEGELHQAILQNDPELRAFVEDMYSNRLMPVIVAFLKEGNRQGYIDPKFSVDTILFYFEVLRRGFFAIPDTTEYTKRNPDLFKELIELVTYGLNG